MKLLTAQEMRACDAATFRGLGVPSRAVMESAGRAVVSVILHRSPHPKRVVVLAGSGNNGGDGFVVSRTLHQLGWEVTTCALDPVEKLSGDARANAEALQNLGAEIHVLTPEWWGSGEVQGVLRAADICVDALYGTGFHGELRGMESELVRFVNAGRELGDTSVISVDIPSGVDATTGVVQGEAIRAECTVTFQFPKIGQVMFPGANHVGDLYVVDIGLWSESPELRGVHRELVDRSLLVPSFRRCFRLPADSHKGQRGHVFVVGGGEGHYGAVQLAGRAALRSGAGLVTLGLSQEGAAHLSGSLSELMSLVLASESESAVGVAVRESVQRFFRDRLDAHPGSLVLGPGLGTGSLSRSLIALMLETARGYNVPVVIDADGLNILAEEEGLWQFVTPQTVLTPHPGEMARLLRRSSEAVQRDRLGAASDLSRDRRCWVVLKGARTVISGPLGEVYVNPEANSALATAGSGDVLAGLIGSLLARGSSPGEGALLGVFLHGEAGRAFRGLRAGVLASDLAEQISHIINSFLESGKENSYPVLHLLPGVDRLS